MKEQMLVKNETARMCGIMIGQFWRIQQPTADWVNPKSNVANWFIRCERGSWEKHL
jgi:hypothetical protein